MRLFLISKLSLKNTVKVTPVLVVLFLASCTELLAPKGISKGHIEYTIEYPQIPENSYLLDLMPKKMETTFMDGNFRSDIIAGMGLFKTSIICQKGEESLIHSVKMLNKKYSSKLNHDQIVEMNKNFSDFTIKKTNETREIAGMNCKAANVTVNGDSTWSFTLFYTNEIDLPKPNEHTPFKEIEGVLMQYDIISYDTHMRFTANKVTINEAIELDKILLEEGYESVSPARLKSEIEAIFATVK